MSIKPLRLVQIRRDAVDGTIESLEFSPGVNVVVGKPNTGKTKWMRMIDFVLGDEKKAEEKLGATLAAKYRRAALTMVIGDEEFTAERRWHEPGAKGKIFIGKAAYSTSEFQQFLLDKLGIPVVHYPQGNPYGPRTWPELSFRSLLRHMYRRQKPWQDIADRQYASEQHACIVQFFGMAEQLFSAQYGEMVQKEKLIAELKLRKDQFLNTLYEVSKELVDHQDLSTAITPESLQEATRRLETEIEQLNATRARIVSGIINQTTPTDSDGSADVISQRSREYAELKHLETNHIAELKKLRDRLTEVETLREQVAAEISRLERAEEAGEVLADLKATHCPVCDQPVTKSAGSSECYLCHQPMPTRESPTSDPLHRVGFELDQLKAEQKEIAELRASLRNAENSQSVRIRAIRTKAGQVAELLRPTRMQTAAIIPPEVAEIEMAIGRCVERIEQLTRIKESFAIRELITAQINEIQKRVSELEKEVNKKTANLDFESPSDLMTDGMNDYTGKLILNGKKMWEQQQIRFRLSKHDLRLRVGKHRWDDQLGETNTIYFLLAYHYALLSTSHCAESRYPWFLIFELPGEVEGAEVNENENFVLEPFIELCNKEGFKNSQVIATGSAFLGLQGANRIELREVWKGAPGQAPEPDDED